MRQTVNCVTCHAPIAPTATRMVRQIARMKPVVPSLINHGMAAYLIRSMAAAPAWVSMKPEDRFLRPMNPHIAPSVTMTNDANASDPAA